MREWGRRPCLFVFNITYVSDGAVMAVGGFDGLAAGGAFQSGDGSGGEGVVPILGLAGVAAMGAFDLGGNALDLERGVADGGVLNDGVVAELELVGLDAGELPDLEEDFQDFLRGR